MNQNERAVKDYAQNRGVDPVTAGLAAKRCASEIEKNTALAASLGIAAGGVLHSPGDLILAVGMEASAPGGTLLAAPSGRDVRRAAMRIVRSP